MLHGTVKRSGTDSSFGLLPDDISPNRFFLPKDVASNSNLKITFHLDISACAAHLAGVMRLLVFQKVHLHKGSPTA